VNYQLVMKCHRGPQRIQKRKKVASLIRMLKLQKIFKKWSDSSEQAVEVSFDISHLIVETSRPLTVRDLKKCAWGGGGGVHLCHNSSDARTA
jgi:hypothetical protein